MNTIQGRETLGLKKVLISKRLSKKKIYNHVEKKTTETKYGRTSRST